MAAKNNLSVLGRKRYTCSSTNRIRKEPLFSAATYKIDMASALEHMARTEELSTDYTERNDEYQMKNIRAVQKCHAKRKLHAEDDGPPDKQKHFQSGT